MGERQEREYTGEREKREKREEREGRKEEKKEREERENTDGFSTATEKEVKECDCPGRDT